MKPHKQAGLSKAGVQSALNHCAPKELAIVAINAILSPIRAYHANRSHIPLSFWVIAAAASATCPQVGLSGITIPAASNKSLRYMIIRIPVKGRHKDYLHDLIRSALLEEYHPHRSQHQNLRLLTNRVLPKWGLHTCR